MEQLHDYFDESIHDRAGFVVGAYVCGPDADSVVSDALVASSLVPGVDEFKSSSRMDRDPQQAALRDRLKTGLSGFRIGVAVAPSSPRTSLGHAAIRGLTGIIRANNLLRWNVKAFFDEGIFPSAQAGGAWAGQHGLSEQCEVNVEQDSRLVKGLQLADLVAHTGATMLLSSLGVVRKMVPVDDNSGYEPGTMIDLGFELWATLRYQFFKGGLPRDVASNADMVVPVEGFGLYIAEDCPDDLRAAASDRFGTCYVGCVH